MIGRGPARCARPVPVSGRSFLRPERGRFSLTQLSRAARDATSEGVRATRRRTRRGPRSAARSPARFYSKRAALGGVRCRFAQSNDLNNLVPPNVRATTRHHTASIYRVDLGILANPRERAVQVLDERRDDEIVGARPQVWLPGIGVPPVLGFERAREPVHG